MYITCLYTSSLAMARGRIGALTKSPSRGQSAMSSGRVLPLTQFVRARDVQDGLGCSRSMAYWHLAQAIGVRPEEQKGRMLRCPLLMWERYAERVFQCRTTTIDSSGARAATDRAIRSGTAGTTTPREGRSPGPRGTQTGAPQPGSAPSGSEMRLSRTTRARAQRRPRRRDRASSPEPQGAGRRGAQGIRNVRLLPGEDRPLAAHPR